jgi:hypothetical protein
MMTDKGTSAFKCLAFEGLLGAKKGWERERGNETEDRCVHVLQCRYRAACVRDNREVRGGKRNI